MFTHYATITILNTQVDDDLTDFPMLVSGTYDGTGGEPDLRTTGNGGKVQNANGYDIIFTSDAAGLTKLDHEIEGYTASTGELIAWVRVPSVSNSIDTVIYMWFGNPYMNTSQENKRAVWDANYKGVWHLGDGSAVNVNDSTGTSNHLTKIGSPLATSGSIYGGINSFSDANYFFKGALTGGSTINTFTISAWIYATSLANYYTVFQFDSLEVGILLSGGAGNPITYIWMDTADEYNANTGLTVTLNTWHYVVAVITPTAATVYLDESSWSNTKSHTAKNLNDGFGIGRDTDTSGRYWRGALDEVRISSTSRSSTWISTEYNNQSDPSSFYTMGSSVTIQYPSIGGILSMGNILSIKMSS